MRALVQDGTRLSVWIALVLLACNAWAAELKLPPLTGRVVDQANILSATTRDRLTTMFADYEKATGEQVVVVTVASLQDVPIEDFGYRLGRAWGIGEKGKSTGALLIIAPKERAVRIEVGYGLEDRLTDAISRAIIERDIVPAFRKGDFDRGVTAGATALVGALGGLPDPAASTQKKPGAGEDDPYSALLLLLVILLFGGFHLFGRRHRHWLGPMGGGMWSTGGRMHDSFGGFSGRGGSFGGGGASGRW